MKYNTLIYLLLLKANTTHSLYLMNKNVKADDNFHGESMYIVTVR